MHLLLLRESKVKTEYGGIFSILRGFEEQQKPPRKFLTFAGKQECEHFGILFFFSPQVYTINLESRYLLIQGVPALGVMKELVEQFALYGAIEEYHALDEYPAEQFTEVYLIKFQKLQCARY